MNTKVIIVILLLLAIIGGGIYYFLYANKPSASESNKTVNTQTQSQNSITLTKSGFEPETLTIKAGDTVTWVNKSGVEGAVYSNPHPIHTSYLPLNLGTFADGASLSLKFDKAGTYGYHNHLNPSETGTIIVQ